MGNLTYYILKRKQKDLFNSVHVWFFRGGLIVLVSFQWPGIGMHPIHILLEGKKQSLLGMAILIAPSNI
jgi:hypothetical protein